MGVLLKAHKSLLFFTYIAIATSGIHFFGSKLGRAIILITLIYYLFICKKLRFKISFFKFLIVTLFILLGQFVIFNTFNVYDFTTELITLVFIPYFLYLIIGNDFEYLFPRVMYLIAFVSILFWICSNFLPGFFNFIQQIPEVYPFLDPKEGTKYQFILYSTNPSMTDFGLLRNPGPFHEPGVYGMFLGLALLFNIVRKGIFQLNRMNFLFIISIVSTFSTVAILSLMIILSYFILKQQINPILKYIFLLALLVLGTYSFFNLPFLNEKIQNEYNIASSRSLYGVHGGRFYGARRSIFVLQNYPVTGRGLTNATEVQNPFSKQFVRYGFMAQAARTGIIATILYLIFLYKGVQKFTSIKNNIFLLNLLFLSIMINLLGQNFGLTAVFLIIIYRGIDNTNFNVKNETQD